MDAYSRDAVVMHGVKVRIPVDVRCTSYMPINPPDGQHQTAAAALLSRYVIFNVPVDLTKQRTTPSTQ